MERRNFLRLGVAGMGVGLIVPHDMLAKACKQTVRSDIYYTKDAPGRWKEKVATHAPTIEIEQKQGKVVVRVVTAHEMKGYEHYIVKHVLLDKDYKFLDEHLFNPNQDNAAVSTFTLEHYKGELHALSLCNKHDLWLSSVTV